MQWVLTNAGASLSIPFVDRDRASDKALAGGSPDDQRPLSTREMRDAGVWEEDRTLQPVNGKFIRIIDEAAGKFPDNWMGVDDECEVVVVLQVGQGEPVMHVVAGEFVCTEDLLRRRPEPIEEAAP
jgi:hypothetical protein